MPNYITDMQGNQVEILEDAKFPWRERKNKTIRLTDVYTAAGLDDYAARAKWCSTYLEYNAMLDGRRQLRKSNFCQLRLCPLCGARRAKKAAKRLSAILATNDAYHDGCQYLFLTLTIRNVGLGELSASLDMLLSGWNRLLQQRPVKRVVIGWFRALEITYSVAKGYHPHIHAIICVEADYFSRSTGKYITQPEWVDRWQQALNVDYKPIVGIQRTKAKSKKSKGMAAALEAAKYAVKDSDYIGSKLTLNQAATVTAEYTAALHKRRLMAFGGTLKEAAQMLGAEDLAAGSLVHLDDERIRDDIAELLEVYRWSFGQSDYLLYQRILSNNVDVDDNGEVVDVSSDSTLIPSPRAGKESGSA